MEFETFRHKRKMEAIQWNGQDLPKLVVRVGEKAFFVPSLLKQTEILEVFPGDWISRYQPYGLGETYEYRVIPKHDFERDWEPAS